MYCYFNLHMLNRFRWTRLRFLKEQCHKIFDTFFHDSNQYGSLIHMLKYFATWSWFRGDMFVCKTKLCGVTNTAESNMLYLIFQQRLFSNLKRQYVISQDFFFFMKNSRCHWHCRIKLSGVINTAEFYDIAESQLFFVMTFGSF